MLMRLVLRIIKLFIVFNVLAVVGALIVRQLVPSEGDEESDTFTLSTVMNGSQFKSRSEALQHARVLTFMGGAEIDFTQAVLADGATLVLQTVMGGVEVRVPPHWRVELQSAVMAGESSTRLDGQDDLPDDAPTLTIEAQTIAGGVMITNKPRRSAAPTP